MRENVTFLKQGILVEHEVRVPKIIKVLMHDFFIIIPNVQVTEGCDSTLMCTVEVVAIISHSV